MTSPSADAPASATSRRVALAGGIVGALAVVEFTSGVIQGYYAPLLTDIARRLGIADADVNWLERAAYEERHRLAEFEEILMHGEHRTAVTRLGGDVDGAAIFMDGKPRFGGRKAGKA